MNDVEPVEREGPADLVPHLWVPPRALAERHASWLLPIQLRGALVASGMTDKAIRHLRENGELARPRFGSYTSGPEYAALDEVGQHAVRSRAVLLRSGTGASLSHASALVWFDAPDWGLDLADVNTTRHDGRTGRREAGIAQHRGQVVDGDVWRVHDITLMNPCRAVLEHTTVSTTESGLVHVNHLLHHGLTTLEELRARYESMTDWPGSLGTEVVLRLADKRVENLLESRFFHLLWRNSIPLPVPQYVVEDGPITVARLDFAWPRLRKWVELDGKVKYEKLLKPGQRASDVVLKEKAREQLVRRLTGMDCDRYTWADVENERRTVARLRRFLFGDAA